MIRLSVLFYLFASFSNTVISSACQFNPACDCQSSPGYYGVSVSCENFAEFPNFDETYVSINTLTISGTFTSIPAFALANFTGTLSQVSIIRTGDLSLPLTIDDDAFLREGRLKVISFKNFHSLNAVPTKALLNADGLTELIINFCSLKTVQTGSFQGLALTKLNLDNCEIVTTDDHAFDGLEKSLLTLSMNGNNFTTIYADSLKNLTALQTLSVNRNQIDHLTNDADVNFPPNIITIDIGYNPISVLPDSVFQNLPALREIRLNNCQFPSVPNKSLFPTSMQLTTADFSYNKIQYITTYTYNFFQNLQDPGIDGNPVIGIEKSAFLGMTSMQVLQLSALSLTTVDLNIACGLPTVEKLVLTHCPMLQNFTTSSVDEISGTLNSINISNGNLKNIDPSIQTWLASSRDKRLIVNGHKNFICDKSIGWMTIWIWCPLHPQINVDNTYCAETRIPLKNYLKTLRDDCP